MIDGVNWNDFSIKPVYAAGSHSRGIFEWGMLYKENNVPKKEEKRRSHHSEPYRWDATFLFFRRVGRNILKLTTVLIGYYDYHPVTISPQIGSYDYSQMSD